MKSIILIGYMCVGKTTIGKSLAQQIGCTFYDLDWYIEERFHKKIPDIFAESGEDGFRRIERRMLHEVAEFEDIVLSCGGGTPCFFDNMEYMNSRSETVYLKADAEVIYSHLLQSKTERPLLSGKSDTELVSFIQKQLAEREPFYGQAKYTQTISLLDDFNKIKYIVEQLKELLHI